MNAVTPLTDYGRYGSAGLRTERDSEYEAFSHVTRLLRNARSEQLGPDIVVAINKNTELWSILATDLAQPGNSLADEIKAGLISLAGFAIRHGLAVLNSGAKLDPLIDVNVAVMKGLRGEVPA
ncbi:flagellar biosynthesis regulator FlaF [Paracoccus tegillarcae]|uniref:flagellar biosynthesis regulator FlaF n=1 Tax=Paracoccus tegillarcae TaxID=1529068 RepID=UPI0013005F32|nr:flagellar biosynthesis regulator FlaF [Paracoccus tegillarcae]